MFPGNILMGRLPFQIHCKGGKSGYKSEMSKTQEFKILILNPYSDSKSDGAVQILLSEEFVLRKGQQEIQDR